MPYSRMFHAHAYNGSKHHVKGNQEKKTLTFIGCYDLLGVGMAFFCDQKENFSHDQE